MFERFGRVTQHITSQQRNLKMKLDMLNCQMQAHTKALEAETKRRASESLKVNKAMVEKIKECGSQSLERFSDFKRTVQSQLENFTKKQEEQVTELAHLVVETIHYDHGNNDDNPESMSIL